MSNVPPPQHGHRVAAVRNAFLHAWKGYRAFAFGHDEISPVTNGTNDSWGGFGVTLVDALDTMYIMGLFHEDDASENDSADRSGKSNQNSDANEFYRDVKAHVQSIDWSRRNYDASFFESSIRYLGGLLSIHQLTGEPLFLAKAVELGDRLLPAFNSPTGIPFSIVNLQTGSARNPAWNGGNSILSELGSVQLEFKQLSTLSGNPNYGHASQKVMDHLAAMPTNGLFPVYINPASGAGASDLVSFGGLGDSFYEYLLKQYILSGGEDQQALQLYVSAVDAMKTSLIGVNVDGRKFLGEMKGGRLTGGFDHLVCYVPGMLALGTIFIEDRHSDLELAIDLLETCISLYKDQPTGLGPERVEFNFRSDASSAAAPYTIKSSRYLLRPETIESLFILYRVTGNMRYQDIGWEIFQSLERYCRTPAAYSGLRDVTSPASPHDNSMQSFFLAETLKYLFLLFSDTSVLSLEDFVFTTEAHPFRFHATGTSNNE